MARYKPIDMMLPYRAKSILSRLTSAQGQRNLYCVKISKKKGRRFIKDP